MHITYLHNSWLKTNYNSKSVLLDTQMSQICIQYKKCFELNKTAAKFRNVKHNHFLLRGLTMWPRLVLHKQSSRLCPECRDYNYQPPCPFNGVEDTFKIVVSYKLVLQTHLCGIRGIKVYVECCLAWTRPWIWSPTTHKQ